MTTIPVPTSSRKVSWDVLRAVAIGLVVLEHATYGAPYIVHELGVRPWEQNLPIGSLVLMVISGYFVCQTVNSAGSGALLRARLVRMMPAFVVATLFTWTVLNLFGPPTWRTGPADLIATALIVPTTLSPHWTLVDPAYWTMVLQLFVFTVVAAVGAVWRPRGAWLHAVLWAVVVVPAAIKLWWLTQPHPHLLDVIFGEARLEKVHLFAAGAAVWLWARKKLGPTVLAVLPAAVWAQYVQNPDDPRLAPALGVFLIALAAAAAGPDWRHPLLEPVLRPLVWLSGISYSTYLMNLGVGVALMWQLRLHGVSPGWQAVVGVISAVTLGWALTRFVERPSTRWWKGRSAARKMHVPRPRPSPDGASSRDGIQREDGDPVVGGVAALTEVQRHAAGEPVTEPSSQRP